MTMPDLTPGETLQAAAVILRDGSPHVGQAVAVPLAAWLDKAATQADSLWDSFVPGSTRFVIYDEDPEFVGKTLWTEETRRQAIEQHSYLAPALVFATCILDGQDE